MHISQRALNTSPSPTLAITSLARRLKSEGVDIASFAAGEPDFDTPQHIKDAAVKALAEGFTKYTPSSGTDQLRDAVAAKFKRDSGLTYTREQIIVSCGAKHSLFNAILAVCDPGDEVIILAPYWVTYPEQVKLAGGKPIIVNCSSENNYQPTREQLQSAVTNRTRAIIINSPGNPTGAVYSRQTLKEIASIAIQHNLIVISDEIYEKIIYDGNEHISIASLGSDIKALTIMINGCSKAYAMTGWRIGYAASTDNDLIKAMGRLQDQSTSNPTSIAQAAATTALNGPEDEIHRMVAAFDERRRVIVEILNEMPGVSCRMPGGAFYAFAHIGELLKKSGLKGSDALAELLLKEARVAVIPGSGFGADDHIRLSYATSMEAITQGLGRMHQVIKNLG